MSQGRYDGAVIISTKIDDAEYRRSLEVMRAESEKFARSAGNGFDSVTKSTISLANALKIGATAFASWNITGFAKSAALAAARYETLGIVAETAGANIGKSAEQVRQYEKDLRATGIAATEARQSIARMAAAGIDLDFGGQIARAAQDLAVVGGLNSSEAFTRMIQAIQSGEQEILKTMGLNVQWEEGYKRLAKQLGKTTDQLTAQEKVQARTNTALAGAAKYAGIYEASMSTAGKQLSSLTRYLDDLQVKVGGVFLDVLAQGVSGFTEMLKEANAQLDEWEKSGALAETSKAIAEGFKAIAGNVDTAAIVVASYILATRGAAIAASLLNGNLAYQITLLRGSVAQFGLMRTAMTALSGLWTLALAGGVAAVLSLATAQSEGEKASERYGEILQGLRGTAEEVSAAIEGIAVKVQKLSAEQASLSFLAAERSLSNLRIELAELQSDLAMGWKGTLDALLSSELGSMQSPFRAIIQDFLDGKIEADAFAKSVAKIGIGLDEVGQEKAEEIIELAYKIKAAGIEADLTAKRAQGLNVTMEKTASASSGAAKATSAFSEALKKLKSGDDLKGLEDYVKYLKDYTKNTELAKKEEENSARAKADLAMAGLKVANMEAQLGVLRAKGALAQAQMTGSTAQRIAAENALTQALAEQAQIQSLISGFEAKIPQVTFSSSGGSGKKPSEYIAEIRKEIVELGRDGGKLYLDELDDALTRIAKSGKEAGVGLKAIGALQKEYKEAFAAAKVREFADALAELEGRGSEVFMRKMAEEARHYGKALIDSGMSAEEAAAQIERFKRASALKVEEGNLETVVNFLKEMSELSGDAALGIEEQNRLLEIQAEILRNNLPPALQGLVDKWLELKKAQMDQSWLGGAKQAINQYTQEWTNAGKIAQKQTEALIGTLQGVTSSAIDALFDGAEFRVDQLFRDLAKQLANILMNQMWAAILGGLFGGGGGGVLGGAKSTWNAGKSLAGGGYTGNAPINKVTGIVHGQEYVLNAATTKSIGVTTLNAINSGKLKLSSFASSSNLPTSGMLTVGGAAVVQPIIEFHFEDHTKGGVDLQTTPAVNSGGDPSRWIINIVAQDMAKGGKTNRATRDAFGLKNIPR